MGILPRGVPRIGFGVYSVTGFYGDYSREEAARIVRRVFEEGVRFFDTADVYGRGFGEEVLCKALGRDVEEAFIATKVGYDWRGGGPPRRRYEPGYLLRAVEESTRRLCKRPVDLVQVHNPPLEALREEWLWEELERIREEGLAAHVGVALGPETDVLEEGLASLSRSPGLVEALQFVYNALEQEPGLHLGVYAASRGVLPIARVPHAGGVLSEELKPGDQLPGDHRSLRRSGWYDWAFRVYEERLKPVISRIPGSPWQRPLRFILDTLPDAVIVVATGSPEKMREALEALELPPSPPEALAEIRRIYLEEVAESPEAPVKSLRMLGLLR